MTATALVRPDKVVGITACDAAEGGKVDARPSTTASCLNRLQPPLPPPHPAGRLCLVERETIACSKDWSRRTVQTTHDKPDDAACVSEGQSSFRGRSKELCLVGRISLRRELDSNPVIGTAGLTPREGHVPSYGDKERVRKICACCPAVCTSWDQFPVPIDRNRSESVSYSLIQHGHKRLCGYAAEPEPQDQPRKKTGNPTAPAFNRVYTPFPPERGRDVMLSTVEASEARRFLSCARNDKSGRQEPPTHPNHPRNPRFRLPAPFAGRKGRERSERGMPGEGRCGSKPIIQIMPIPVQNTHPVQPPSLQSFRVSTIKHTT